MRVLPPSDPRVLVIDTLGYEEGNPDKVALAINLKIGTYTKSGAQDSLD
jgi:hypothetical protein